MPGGVGGQGKPGLYPIWERGCWRRTRTGTSPASYLGGVRPGAIERRWLPSSYDWSRTHARRRGGESLERLSTGDWPSAGVVTAVYGSWKAARAAAAKQSSRLAMAIDGRGSVGPDDTRPAGREVIADRRPHAHDCAGSD